MTITTSTTGMSLVQTADHQLPTLDVHRDDR